MTYRAEFHLFDGSVEILEEAIPEVQLTAAKQAREMFNEKFEGIGYVKLVAETPVAA